MSIFSPSHCLSIEELESLIPFECPIYPYTDIKNFNNISELLYPNGCCIIFYETSRNNKVIDGHWTCLTVSPRSESVIEESKKPLSPQVLVYFNSYGTIPDDEKKFIDKKHQEIIGQLENSLSVLLYNSNEDVEYNELKLQKLNNNNCGRHVVCKILTKDLSLERYQNFMVSPTVSPDDKVLILTNEVLKGKISPKTLQNKLIAFLLENQSTNLSITSTKNHTTTSN